MKMKVIKDWFSRVAEEDMKEDTNRDRVMSILIMVFSILIMLYFILHQTWTTGFFTTTFGAVEMVMLYGTLIFWIFTSAVLLFGLKNLSRNIDSF
ncbi:MAG: hypothetical protein ACFFDN_42305, partial [Candidatus Hodarchaeota archaeon]